MSTKELSRRQLLSLSSVGVAVGMGFGAAYGVARLNASKQDDTTTEESDQFLKTNNVLKIPWQYVKLDSATVALDAYRLMNQGGCMYGIFASILGTMSQRLGEPYASFPLHMMKYGAGGVGLWGSLCGTLNGGAAVIGLFVSDNSQRERLISQLFSWYESTELPTYRPDATNQVAEIPKSVAESVLCHVSASKWCRLAGKEVGSQEMQERCRRLTADVAGKTVELLNANVEESCAFSELTPDVQSCLLCHGKSGRRDTFGQMRCGSCHQRLSEKHPPIQ